MMKKSKFSHMICCSQQSRIEQPKIKSIKEVKEFMSVLSKKGYILYPEKTQAKFFKDFNNCSGAITKITDDEVRPRKIVIKGHNLEIMLHNHCSADHLYSSPNKPYTSGIKGYIKVGGKNKHRFPEIVYLIKNYWKPRLLSEFEV
jgi:hypothetical protein